jgi:hypothetical protein
VKNEQKVPGLDGIELARLEYLKRVEVGGTITMGLAGIKCCRRVAYDDIFLPVYAYTGEFDVIRADRIERNLHVVPLWNNPLIVLAAQLHDPDDIYGLYDGFVLNIHSDAAAWNFYYDYCQLQNSWD